MQVTVRGEGHSAMRGGTNGDLLVVIKEETHSNLRRDGNNLFYTRIISVMDAMLGCELSVPCLDGSYKVKLDPGTQSGTVIKLRGKGLPSVQGYGRGTGDDNETDRKLSEPVHARFVRLNITQGDQVDTNISRIYEFGVY